MDNILELLDIFVNSLSLVIISDMFKFLFILFAFMIAMFVLIVFFYLFLFKVIYNFFVSRTKKDS